MLGSYGLGSGLGKYQENNSDTKSGNEDTLLPPDGDSQHGAKGGGGGVNEVVAQKYSG